MLESIKNTLKRLSGKISIFNPVNWYPLFLEGLSVEINRVREFKNEILSATVANDDMTPDSIDDYNKKYGIPSTLSGTDQEKINRIIEKASLSGFPGPEWLQDQIQLAGFQLYVIENKPLVANVRQYGNDQYSIFTKYGLSERFVNPDIIPGKLVVCSPPSGSGRVFLSQYSSSNQYDNFQYGTPDPNALNPQPFVYERTDDPTLWGFYFTLSPFSDRVAVDESEFLEVPTNEFNYLCNLIIEIKMLRNRCILQAKAT